MSDIQNEEFREQQETTQYPFADHATLTARSGATLLPDTFLDASLYPVGSRARVRISKIDVINREITVYLGDATQEELAFCVFDPFSPPAELHFTDSAGRPAGVLVSDMERIAGFQTWSQGSHVFPLGSAEFVASCVVPVPEYGLRGIKIGDDILSGDVWFIGEQGVAVRAIDGEIRIDVVGDPLFVRRTCGDMDQYTPPTILRRINDIPPDIYGFFGINVVDDVPNTLLRIRPISQNTLKIELVGQLSNPSPPGE